MAQDPAFLFYPGDYLRDTQVLSESAQVAYDRIMCEHMRNICEDMINITVSKETVKFITKKLSDDEREEVYHVLTKIGEDYQIQWVAESIAKRKQYSDSRRKNRSNKEEKKQITYDKHIKTYDSHMEIENENENENINKEQKKVKRKVLSIPDKNELAEYFVEKGSTKAQAELFYHFYNSKNWMVGKVKMVNWRSAASGWIMRNKTNSVETKKSGYSYNEDPEYLKQLEKQSDL